MIDMKRVQRMRSSNRTDLEMPSKLVKYATAIIIRNEAKIPSFNTKLVTVTEVRMSSDLKSARAYVIPLGGKDTEKTVNTLTEFSHLVRKAQSKKLDIKFLPKLHFVGDGSFDYAEKIEKLIKENSKK